MRPLPSFIEIFETRDGSPTLIHQRADGYTEKMHHSGGALSESFYIYHEALKDIILRGWRPRILSVGLGLGYNEMIAIAELLDAGLEDWRVWSFEASDELRDEFVTWLRTSEPQSELHRVHDKVCGLVAAKFGASASGLKQAIAHHLNQGQLSIHGAFPDSEVGVCDVNLVFYDAYSRKMDPHLWTEEGMVRAFDPLLSPQASFTTYAATGSLNRSLKQLGFRLTAKPGFDGKRESTLAIRELIR